MKLFTRRGHLALATLLWLATLVAVGAGRLEVQDLKCEYMANPINVDISQPRLSWVLKSHQRGEKQTAYQILVASSPEKLKAGEGDFWNTGKVESDATAQIEYAGKPLGSRQSGYWKVRVWDGDGKQSEYSAPASWETGLLDQSDWKARWIGRTTDVEDKPAPTFRREITLGKKIKRARAYICGLGYYELHINGEKVGDHLLDPGYTRYDKRALTVAYDVTEHLKKGANVVGVTLGNGWQNVQTKAVWNFHKAPWRAAPKLLFSLHVEYSDGTEEVIGSDDAWRCATGPIVFNSIYGGETYDARLEKLNWDRPGYDDTTWEKAIIVEGPQGKLVAQMMPAIEVDHYLKPVSVSNPKPGVFLVDMGQNFAGCAELTVKGPAGTHVVMRYGERLATNGLLDADDIQQHIKKLGAQQQYQTDTYILKGKGTEVWRSRFVYHGFQYVELTGYPGVPTVDSLRGVFFHTAVPVAGKFECSNPLFNKIAKAARWSYLSNLQGIPTDCPHREKNGWTGDAHLAAEQAIYNFMPAGIYTKWINDVGGEQRSSGKLPGIVPTSGWGYEWGNGPAWDSAFLLIPYYLEQYYGDTRVLDQHYEGMRRYVDYLTSQATNGIVSIGLNDWAPYKTKTPAQITSTAYYYRDAQIVASTAARLGKSEDAKTYSELAIGIKKSFNDKFIKGDAGLLVRGSQTALSCALYQGLAETEDVPRILSNLVTAIEKQNGHIDTGILGAKYILNALTENGRADVAYRIAAQKDEPSWGWWIEQGATTLWEQWNGTESRNHIMFGDISAWFYKAVAGINVDPAAPAFKHIIIKAEPVGDLTFARAEYHSIRGEIISDWKIEKHMFRLKVTIPPNTTASVYVPGSDAGVIREGSKPASKSEGVRFARQEDGRVVFEIGSGEYEFLAPMPN